MGLCTTAHRTKFSVLPGEDALHITPTHPIKVKEDGVWTYRHPRDLNGVKTEEGVCGRMYSFAVNVPKACLVVNTICVLTLAHGITGDEVAEHDYYGTDAIFKDYPKGEIHTICCV
jgi:hypothetical protein